MRGGAPGPLDLVVTGRRARFLGRSFPCTVGRGGIRPDKREGDGATPEGVHGFIGLLHRPDRVARSAVPGWARPIGLCDIWSDDPRDPDYNLYLQSARHPFGHERLRRADPLYDVILLTDWNWPRAEAGAGSAIFVHAWRAPGHPTAGCIGLDPRALRWIAHRLRHRSRLIVRAGAQERGSSSRRSSGAGLSP